MGATKINGFKPGNKLSLGRGRPPGSKNRKATLQAVAHKSLLERMEDLNNAYWEMSPSAKLRYFEVMLPYATPRLQATSINKWDHKSDEELEATAAAMIKALKQEKETRQLKANGKIEEVKER
jgi:hypothetical protein